MKIVSIVGKKNSIGGATPSQDVPDPAPYPPRHGLRVDVRGPGELLEHPLRSGADLIEDPFAVVGDEDALSLESQGGHQAAARVERRGDDEDSVLRQLPAFLHHRALQPADRVSIDKNGPGLNVVLQAGLRPIRKTQDVPVPHHEDVAPRDPHLLRELGMTHQVAVLPMDRDEVLGTHQVEDDLQLFRRVHIGLPDVQYLGAESRGDGH